MLFGLVPGLNLLLSLTGFTDLFASYQAVARDQYAADLLVGLVCYGFISAFCEELLFRGILYHYLCSFFPRKAAFVVSAVFFSVYHGNAVQGVYAFLMGLLLAYVYEYFGRFKAPVLAHMSANILAYLLTYGGAALPWLVSWPVCVFLLVLGVGSLYLLARQKLVL
ncbi:MAG: CPBP family intramembrane metalloprotease [Roseburia sp.]|nr:CPBP family intramembrane metalloprotease [Roseburia sp.]